MGDLLELSPSGTLEFRVAATKSSATTLTARNLSKDKAIALKVKTTQPSWYYVRPNQEILGPGESLEISITLIENESRRSFALHLKGTPLDHSRHRFQVQSCTLTDGLAGEIRGIVDNNDGRKKALAKVWNEVAQNNSDKSRSSSGSGSSSGGLKNTQLKVVYVYDDNDALMPSEMGLDENGQLLDNPLKSKPVVVETVSSRVEKMRQEFKEEAEKADYGSTREIPENFEAAKVLYKKLKKKYVALEDWTIALTGQLDAIRAEVDGLRNQVAKEKMAVASEQAAAVLKKEEGKGASNESGKSKGDPQAPLIDIRRRGNQSMFMAVLDMRLSLFIVGAGVVIAYLLGRTSPSLFSFDNFSLGDYIKVQGAVQDNSL